MEKLFSPWRSQFIDAASRGEPLDSPFASAWRDPDRDRENLLLHRGRLGFIILNRYPYNAGHLLVCPIREVGDFVDLTPDERAEMNELVALGIEVLRRVMAPHGFNVGMNLGRVAGAGIPSHVHTHVVPRWNGDTNFMPVIDEVRVISHLMEDVYDRLRAALSDLA